MRPSFRHGAGIMLVALGRGHVMRPFGRLVVKDPVRVDADRKPGVVADVSDALRTFSRLLQNMAASPGAFDKVRVFKCLNSGQIETSGQPEDSGTVWNSTSSPPDFTVTLDGAELVKNNLTPYVVLGLSDGT